MSMRMRRGGAVDAGPPNPPATYGPTDGAAAVRAGAGPRTVSNPGGGISFNSSGSLQSAIDANPTSSTFVCSVNNPLWNSTVNTGTKRPTIIFPGSVGQVTIDGLAQNAGAFSTGDGAVIKGGTFTNFLYDFSVIVLAGSCVIEDVVMHDLRRQCIASNGVGNRISYSRFYNAYVQALGGPGDNLTVDHCDIYGNNTSQSNPDAEGGAHKFANVSNGSYHHNWVHGNIGYGAWWDTGNFDWLIEESVMEDNYRAGFFFEANAGSVIRRNYIANNGRDVVIGGGPSTYENNVNARLSDDHAGVSSPWTSSGNPVQFTRNIVDHTLAQSGRLGGLILVWDHSANATRHLENVQVFENQCWMRTTDAPRVGGLDTATSAYPVWSLNNTFYSNEYRVASNTPSYWRWDTGTGGGVPQTFAAWQGFHPTGEVRFLI